MFAILHAIGMFVADLFKSRSRLEAENLFLRHQLTIAMRRARPRLRLRGSDRALLIWIDPALAEPARHGPGWSCCNLRALGCCSQAWVAWTSVRRCADMARPIADYDAGPTFGRSLDYPSKRSSITWFSPLSPQREYSGRAHDGARARG